MSETAENVYADQIRLALYETKLKNSVEYYGRKKRQHSDGDCDDVYEGKIFIGNAVAAKNIQYLKSLGVTHILNCAEGTSIGMVDTNQQYYDHVNIIYKGFHIFDLPTFNIGKFFEEGSDYIDNCLKNNGKVLVNCSLGMSRSAAIVLAYLMIKKEMDAIDAVKTLRLERPVCPNFGFIQSLAKLQVDLINNF